MNIFGMVTISTSILGLSYWMISSLVNGNVWLNFFIALALSTGIIAILLICKAANFYHELLERLLEHIDILAEGSDN
jgi:hypothetical protein